MRRQSHHPASKLLLAGFVFSAQLIWAGPAHAQRVALLIGNSSYQTAGLTNPANDVRLMEATLSSIGFKVQKVLNANQSQMKRAVRDFGTSAQGAEVAFIYYSGHGTQAGGENFLLPIGATIDKEADYEVEAVSANSLMRQISGARPKAAIVVLDACRDNPYASATKSISKGLTRMDAPTGTMIAFATSPNNTAGDEGHYARALAARLKTPGMELLDVFRDTTADVLRLTKGKQEPRISEVSISSRIYLAGEPAPNRLATEESELIELFRQVKTGDTAALAKLERNARYLSMKARNNLSTAAHSVSGSDQAQSVSSDPQSVALSIAQSQSQNPDERALGEAMIAYLQFSSTGLARLHTLSNSGNRFASMMLERIYRVGVNAKKDAGKAKQFDTGAQEAYAALQQMAETGNPVALSWLGNRYRNSEDSAELSLARPYFERAAKAGYIYAYRVLGNLYDFGKGGVAKNDEIALVWYRKAADAGDGGSMSDLARMYERGISGQPKDEANAAQWYQKSVNAGYPGSKFALALYYLAGRGGLAKDEKKAGELFLAAADDGNPYAMGNLAYCYQWGNCGLTKDEVKAVAWFRKSAEAGYDYAMAQLGDAYQFGRVDLPKDAAKAVEWYQKGVAAGDGYAMLRLGEAHLTGYGGVAKDDGKAAEWFGKGASAGSGPAMRVLGDFHISGRGGLAKDEAKAAEWYKKSALANDPYAMLTLADAYQFGSYGMVKDPAKAVDWYRKSADAGVGNAMARLGVAYSDGYGGLVKDDVKAAEWYQKAADANVHWAIRNLGWFYKDGRGGLTKDETKALALFRRAADLKDPGAMTWLGHFHREGLGGLVKDDVTASEWYRKGAEGGDGWGMTEIAYMYEAGRGVTKDGTQAIGWYRKAAAQGIEGAKKRLAELGQ